MLQYNKELSESIAQALESKIEVKGCYQNAYHIADYMFFNTPVQGTINILFCYAPFHHEMFFRHAFCLLDDQLIEPLPNLDMGNLDVERIVPIRRMNMEEYRSLILNEGYFDLFNALQEDEVRVLNETRINVNPIDLVDLIRRDASTTKEFIEMLENWNVGHGLPVSDSNEMDQTLG